MFKVDENISCILILWVYIGVCPYVCAHMYMPTCVCICPHVCVKMQSLLLPALSYVGSHSSSNMASVEVKMLSEFIPWRAPTS